MNCIVTSKDEILKTSRELLQKQGWSAINIRSVAAGCNVSVGSIYNYFESKEDLVASTIESVWCEVFHGSEDVVVYRDTQACISWIYRQMEYGHDRYPEFFTLHSMSFLVEEKSEEKQRMQRTWQHILDGLSSVLRQDPKIRIDAFSESFTLERFADTLFSLMMASFLRQDYDAEPVLEIVRRVIY